MNFDEIRNLVKLMGEYNLTEVKIESEDCNLCFRRGDDRAPMAPVAVPAVMPVAAPAPAPALTAPQYAERRPMPLLRCNVTRFESTSAR